MVLGVEDVAADPAGTAATIEAAHVGAPDAHGDRAYTDQVASGKANTAHTHSGADITSGTLGVARLPVGTGVSTIAAGNDSRIVGAMQKANNLSDLTDASAARANMGLGTAATRSVGTVAGSVAAGNDARLSDARTVDPLRRSPLVHRQGAGGLPAGEVGSPRRRLSGDRGR